MKQIIIFIIISIISFTIQGQDKIILKSGKTISNARLYEIKKYNIVYEKAGNLHDLYIHLIERIETDTCWIKFKGNQPIYYDYAIKENTKQEHVVPVKEIKKVANTIQKKDIGGSTYFKFAPLALLEFEPSLQMAVEHAISSKVALQGEVGLLFINHYNTLFDKKVDWGYKLRPEIRFYYKHNTYEHKPRLKRATEYFACQLFYKYIKYDDMYVQYKQSYGMHFKAGCLFVKKSDLVWDVYVGLGFRQVTKKSVSSGYDYNTNRLIDIYSIYKFGEPSVSLGVNIGFAL